MQGSYCLDLVFAVFEIEKEKREEERERPKKIKGKA